MRRRLVGSLSLVTALLLAGCSGAQDPAAPEAPQDSTGGVESPSPAPMPTDDQGDALDPSGLVDEDTGETIEPQEVPQWDEASRSSVIDAADTALRAFARPGLDHETWWAELQPLLTQQAAEDYAYVDPANIPASEVTGAGELVDETSAYVGVVEAPTDVGPYTVILNRKSGADEWMVSRITPPEDVN